MSRRVVVLAAAASLCLLLLLAGSDVLRPAAPRLPSPAAPTGDPPAPDGDAANAGTAAAAPDGGTTGRADGAGADGAGDDPAEGAAAADAPEAGEVPGAPAADDDRGAGPPRGFFPDFRGTVVDVDTGEPVAGARVEYGTGDGSWGDRSGADGAFRFFDGTNPPARPDPRHPWFVRVYAPGYETLEIEPRDADATLALRPRSGPPAYGRIRGRAEDGQGRPLPGALSVTVMSDENRSEWLTVLADGNGAFTLEALDPGGCRLSLERGPVVSVFVPEGGVAEVVLRTREELDATKIPPFGEEAAAELRRLEDDRNRLAALLSGDAPAEDRAAISARLARATARLRELRAAGVPTRRPRAPVTVTGLDGAEGARLVAEGTDFEGSNERWWALVRDGRARFPGFFAGEWRLTLVTPDGARKSTVEVPAATGPVTVRFDAD